VLGRTAARGCAAAGSARVATTSSPRAPSPVSPSRRYTPGVPRRPSPVPGLASWSSIVLPKVAVEVLQRRLERQRFEERAAEDGWCWRQPGGRSPRFVSVRRGSRRRPRGTDDGFEVAHAGDVIGFGREKHRCFGGAGCLARHTRVGERFPPPGMSPRSTARRSRKLCHHHDGSRDINDHNLDRNHNDPDDDDDSGEHSD
jgi:hypothetical protein